MNRVEGAYIHPNPRKDEGTDYFSVFKATENSKVVEQAPGNHGVTVNKIVPTLEEVENAHASSSTTQGYEFAIKDSGELIVAMGPYGNPLPPTPFTDEQHIFVIGNSLNVEWLSQLMRPIRPRLMGKATQDDFDSFEKLKVATETLLERLEVER